MSRLPASAPHQRELWTWCRNADLTNYADKEYGGAMVHMYGGSVAVGFLVDVGALERVVRQAVAMVKRGRNGADVEV